MPGSVEAVPLAAACGRSVGARPAARLTRAGREEPIVGVSVAGIAAWEGLAPNRLAGKWRRKGLKRFNPRRETVWPRQPWSPNI